MEKHDTTKRATKRAKRTGVREPGGWKMERPLTTLYRGHNFLDLAALARGYIGGTLSYEELKQQVPETTNWLRASEPMKRRCAGQTVAGILGWCPMKDEKIDLDPIDPKTVCFTNRFVMAVEKSLGLKVYFQDLFPDCEHNDGGCKGQIERVQECQIHALALIIDLEVAVREFDIRFIGFWGMGKLWNEGMDEAVFSNISWAAEMPRVFTNFHISKVCDDSREIQKIGVLQACADMEFAIGMVTCAMLYDGIRNVFQEWKDKFKLPPRIIEGSSKIATLVRSALSGARTSGFPPRALANESAAAGPSRYNSPIAKRRVRNDVPPSFPEVDDENDNVLPPPERLKLDIAYEYVPFEPPNIGITKEEKQAMERLNEAEKRMASNPDYFLYP